MPELKKKKYSWAPENPFLMGLMQSPAGILAINWVFQGIRGMESKELSFRMIIEVMIAIIFYFFIFSAGRVGVDLLLSFILAHTCNWLFNTHLWVCVRYFPLYRRNPEILRCYLDELENKLKATKWLDEAVCIGSVGDNNQIRTGRSDIDLRLIFPSGLLAWAKTNLLLIKLRTIALFKIIPLDLYAYNDVSALNRFRQDEGLKVIVDRQHRISNRYADRISKRGT